MLSKITKIRGNFQALPEHPTIFPNTIKSNLNLEHSESVFGIDSIYIYIYVFESESVSHLVVSNSL